MLGRMLVRESLGVLRGRDFHLLLAGQTLSNFGSALVPVALAFAVLDLTGSATDLGLVLLASRLPNMVLVLTGGVVADRRSLVDPSLRSHRLRGGRMRLPVEPPVPVRRPPAALVLPGPA